MKDCVVSIDTSWARAATFPGGGRVSGMGGGPVGPSTSTKKINDEISIFVSLLKCNMFYVRLLGLCWIISRATVGRLLGFLSMSSGNLHLLQNTAFFN